MSGNCVLRAARPAGLISALLVSSALIAPAFAQIETVVVTAQKRSENVQTVPIAISAFTSEDLKAHQIFEFKDLQFATPNVTYTKGNFTVSDFQIRGIGYAAVAGDAETGVAVHQDDVYLENPLLISSVFYDLSRIEVLRGPQSTLYGRGATGGTVNIITAKPDLETFGADGEASYGNYNMTELKGMVNIPLITDQLAVRLAGDWLQHDGYTENLALGNRVNGENTYSFRGSIRWQPSSHTIVDLIGSLSRENDRRMRSDKQLCSFDPTGTLGCLPDSLGHDTVNEDSVLATISSSVQGINAAFAGTPLAGLGNALGLFDLTQGVPQLSNPSNPWQIETDFNPIYKAHDNFAALNIKQDITPWLSATFVGGYDDTLIFSQESYNNSVSPPIDPGRLALAEGTLLGLLTALGGPDYAAHYAPYFSNPGELPVSSTKNLGLTGGDIAYYTPNNSAYDQSDGGQKQFSAELRFNSNLEGPVNFMLAGYYLHSLSYTDYFVNASTFDYASILLGSITGLNAPALCFATGCLQAPSFYHNVADDVDITSKAIFGEVYYDIFPDTLKLTLGARYTDDTKSEADRIEILSGLVPIGTTDENAAMIALAEQGQVDFDPTRPGFQPIANFKAEYGRFTGRAVLDWTPKLSFTDASLFYASYSRGYKAGGFNPGIEPGLDVPVAYRPEGIDAFEAGTKNTLYDGTLQANLAAFYYNYQDLQVSSILNNTSVNQNVGARIWGFEGEFVYSPVDNLQFNMNFGHTDSRVGDFSLVDPRNPTGGLANAVLIKDATLSSLAGENCVLYMINGQSVSPGDNGAFQAALAAAGHPGLFFDPPGGSQALAAHGIANTNFGSCLSAAGGGLPDAFLNAFGYSRTDPTTGATDAGVAVNLHGNELQNTPPWTLSFGAQYTIPVGGNYSLIPRVDIYWQDKAWARIFEEASDRMPGYATVNAQLTLNSPDDRWYVQGFVKNMFDKNYITGEYLTSATSGLYTNTFFGDPRTYGIRIGAHL